MNSASLPYWVPLAAAIIAAIAVIAGATVGPLVQHRITARRERKTLRLQKAEEIYHELRRLKGEIDNIGFNFMGQQLKLGLKVPEGVFDPGLLRVLLRVYFPGAEDYFTAYDRQVAELLKPLASGVVDESKGKAPDDAAEISTATHGGLYLVSRELLDKITAFMDEQVKQLL